MSVAMVITYVWLFAVLALLFLIWRSSAGRLQRTQQALIEVSNKSADAAKLAAEAASRAVSLIEKRHEP